MWEKKSEIKISFLVELRKQSLFCLLTEDISLKEVKREIKEPNFTYSVQGNQKITVL